MKLSKNQIFVGLAIGAVAAVGIWATIHYSKIPALTGAQSFEVKAGAIKTEIDADVTLKAKTSADLSFENTGKIKSVLVKVGDQVKAGQLLAQEENSDYAVALREAQAKARAAEADLSGAQENVDVQKAKLHSLKNADAKKYDVKAQKETVDQADTGSDSKAALLDAAHEAVNGASLELAKTRLVAPFDGVITGKTGEVGEIAASGQSIITLATGSDLHAEAFVSELEVKRITVGDLAEIQLVSLDGDNLVFSAQVETIDPAETNMNGAFAYKVVLRLDRNDPELKSGMTGTAKIKISDLVKNITIPQSSLFSEGGKNYVMTISGGLPERKEVEVGAVGSDGTVEILSGLQIGDRIIKF